MKLSKLAKRMIITIVVISLACVLISIVYYRSLGFIPFFLGALLGSAVSILKVFLLERAVDKALKMDKSRAGTYVALQHLLRLLLSGIVLVLGALIPNVSIWGVVAGILAFQLATYGVKFNSSESKDGS